MSPLPGTGFPWDEHFERNLIGGSWEFPAVPFEYQIRSPQDGGVLATVPMSSRLDVARAVRAAGSAAGAWAADPALRRALLTAFVTRLGELAGPLADLQSAETGLSAGDSAAATQATLRFAKLVLPASQSSSSPRAGGHILSWGLPLAEVTCSVLPQLAAGRTAVIKPSLRAPLSAAAFAHLAAGAGFPPGVINLVQGTGIDVGTALLGSPDLGAIEVRASERTAAQAARAATVTGATITSLRAGGNVLIAGRDAETGEVASVAADALRTHSAGGPLALPVLCAHEEIAGALTEAVAASLAECRPAPLPAEPLRDRALAAIASLRAAGARLICGGTVPDDARHRMGWIVPPTLLAAGPAGGPASRAALAAEPTGPVLTILTWRSPADLAGIFAHPRYADGLALTWGIDDAEFRVARLPHTTAVSETTPLAALAAGSLPPAWIGGLWT